MRDFEELRIRVRQIGAQRYVVLANGVAQGGHAVRIGADAEALREEFNRLIAIEVGDEPSGPTDTRTGLRKLGRSVYDLIFDDALTESVRKARSRAEENGRGLRLRFDLPPAVQALPIEALCSPADQPEQTLALDGTLSIARSVPGALPGNRLPTGAEDTNHLRLLVAIATPTGANLPPIDAAAELSALGELSEFFVHTDVIHNATRADIDNWLTANTAHPTAVLLIAHGGYAAERGEGVVILAAKDGTADPIPAQLLSGMLVRAQRLRLVALNLCFGGSNTAKEPFAGLANAIIGKGIPAVVAMPGLVTDRAAGVFGPKLIAGLCANILLDEAVTSARHHIANLPGHTAIEWASPMLFFNVACGHGWLFKAREVREGERVDPLRAGEEAVHQVTSTGGNITPATALVAARFLRLRGDWRRVESTAKTTQPSRERDQLIAEARFEMAWPTVENVCTALADANPAVARQRLDAVRELVPTPVLRLLTSEITAAETLNHALGRGRAAEDEQDWPTVVECYQQIERDQLPGTADVATPLANARQEIELAARYADLRPLREAGRWEALLDAGNEILAIRPSGYRDTVLQVTYAESRIVEAHARWAEAVDGYVQCADFLDAPARLAYSLGRLAAEHRHWAKAEQHFRDATELGVGEDYRIGYAEGRAHEDVEEWAAALGCYADLPDSAIDIAARKRYAQGRIAALDSDWTGVIDGFGELPDDFADGEVGRLRQFARAKLAEQRTDWRTVLTLLGALPDGGAVGLLRWKARGELAEADGNWARAAQCYASAGLEPEHRYAAARQAELDEDWSTALENFRALPNEHRDAAQRITYAAARAAESISDWPGAVELYTELPNDFADVQTRLPYARLCAAIEARHWLDVEAVAEELGDYRNSATLAAYARARSAEEDADWAQALLAYQSCGEYADAPSRATYAKARQLDAAGHWSAAKTAYEQAEPLDPDTKNRIE
ncbi:MAG TPA: CHAT domain-containing protein, partial [Pseudonocardiaceae bacterium]|nr:CHAT domain-containing protein [Pseudonocardiaceae bacterium]